jgi:hypothetical protein
VFLDEVIWHDLSIEEKDAERRKRDGEMKAVEE